MEEDLVDDFLAHYGVAGMKWGRRSAVTGVSRKVNRMASKDAKEHVRAKLYYGEGAGIRRRQINNVVKDRSKDPSYRKAFDQHVSNQDVAKASSAAKAKRTRTDVVKGTAKTVRGVRHIINGNPQYASAATAVVVGGAMYAHRTGIDKMLLEKGKTLLNSPQFKKGANDIFDQIKNYKG